MFCLLLYGVNADLFAVFTHSFKFDFAVDFGKEGVVGASADIFTGMDMCTALFDKNIARKHELPVGAFYAESFGFGIAAVLCRADTFFMGK